MNAPIPMVPIWTYPLLLPLIVGFIVWLRTKFRYRISGTHFEVTLWGLRVRRIALRDIEQVSVRHRRWAEQWWNTWRPARRRLLIRRRRGLCRNIIITPERRYEFKAELERAMLAASPSNDAPASALPAPDTKPSA